MFLLGDPPNSSHRKFRRWGWQA